MSLCFAKWEYVSECCDRPIGSDFISVAQMWLSNKKHLVENCNCVAALWGLWKLRNCICLAANGSVPKALIQLGQH